MKKPAVRHPDVRKTTLYAIVVNAIQIAALMAFVLYVTLADLSGQSRFTLQLIAVVGALLAGWGALIDIQDALQTRRRVRTINELQTVNEQMDTLNYKLRAQRHDFLNHIQVVYSLLEMEEAKEAADYLERVYTELHSVSRVLRTKVTAFNALLEAKSAECNARKIALELDVRSALEGLQMPSWELCCVVGNLLDNAMDATAAAPQPHVALRVMESLRSFDFTISNNGDRIPPELQAHIFEAGVTTKGEGHGMGLSIVRQRLDEYGGSIRLEAAQPETVFALTLPREIPCADRDEPPIA